MKKKYTLAVWAGIIAILCLILEVLVYRNRLSEAAISGDSAYELGFRIGLMLVVPHLIVYFAGLVMNWLSVGLKVKGCILAAAILYGVALILAPQNFITVCVPLALSIWAYCKARAADKAEELLQIQMAIQAQQNPATVMASAQATIAPDAKEPFVIQPRTAYIIGGFLLAGIVAFIVWFCVTML